VGWLDAASAEQQGEFVALLGGQRRRRVYDSADVILQLLHSPVFGYGAADGCEPGVVGCPVAAECGDASPAVEPLLRAEVVAHPSDG
jgi:hypothetical protein